MKFTSSVILVFALLASRITAAVPELDAALAAKDHDQVLQLFKTRDFSEAEMEKVSQWFALEKEKYRKKYIRAVAEKQVTSPAAGQNIHKELLRLIKENQVEDDTDYTLACLRAAGINKNPDLIYAISPFLVHPQGELRAEANKAIARKRDERVYPVLGQLLAGENAIDKVYAMETLLALKDERAVPLLLLQLSNSNKNVRYFALKTLGAINSDKAQYGIIHVAHNDADEEVRLKAIAILSQFKTGPVFFALQKLISDGSIIIREKALESALISHDKKFAPAVSEQLARETVERHKHTLLKALLTLGSGGGMNGVLTLLRREKNPELLLWSAYACNRFAEMRCAEPLAAVLLASHDESIMLECVVALGTFRQRKQLPALITIIQDEKRPALIRSAALASIQQYDSEAVIAPLFEIFAQENNQSLRVQVRGIITDLMRRKLPKV